MNLRITTALVLALALMYGNATAIGNGEQAGIASGKGELPTRNKQIVEAAFARWAAGGTGLFDELLAENVVWTIKGSSPSAGVYTGRVDFVARAVRPFAIRMENPVRPVATRVWADGDHVIVNWDGEGVARDGVPYRNSYAWIFRMADGKVVEATVFLDLAPYDEVLRRVPPPKGG